MSFVLFHDTLPCCCPSFGFVFFSCFCLLFGTRERDIEEKLEWVVRSCGGNGKGGFWRERIPWRQTYEWQGRKGQTKANSRHKGKKAWNNEHVWRIPLCLSLSLFHFFFFLIPSFCFVFASLLFLFSRKGWGDGERKQSHGRDKKREMQSMRKAVGIARPLLLYTKTLYVLSCFFSSLLLLLLLLLLLFSSFLFFFFLLSEPGNESLSEAKQMQKEWEEEEVGEWTRFWSLSILSLFFLSFPCSFFECPNDWMMGRGIL